jgi:hypothetical protein
MGIQVFPAAGGGVVLKTQTFTSSGTFTLPSGYGASNPLIVDLEICGGGGGGGSGGASSTFQSGGGGGGGSGVVALYKGVSLTSNATITIGAGGAGGAAVAPDSIGNNGSSGGASNVNSTFYAPGGGGGSLGRHANNTGTMYGRPVAAYGFYITGGYQSGGYDGAGGAGGSGGSAGYQIETSNPTANYEYRGGSKGWPGLYYTIPSNTSNSVSPLLSTVNGQGLGIATIGSNTGAASAPWVSTAYSEILMLQRGGGGGGGEGYTNPSYGLGGNAGTINEGGLNGVSGVSSGTITGGTATDPGCGGGGGGARRGAGNAGAGGAGASGYVKVTYWA